MPVIDSDTLVTCPDRETRGRGRVVLAEALDDGRWAVVLDETPAHPVGPTWPDQGADSGAIEVGGSRHVLLDCRIAAWRDGVLHVGDRLPACLGAPEWSFVVAHVIADGSDIAEGEEASVEIDERRRSELSRGHTACHLASLALNAALSGFWSKPVREDSLGHPDFDQAAIQSSLIRESGSTDVYRLGRSLRRSGFDAARLRDELPAVVAHVDDTLAGWVASDAPARIDRDDIRLSGRRVWRCELPGRPASLPCGGTHVASLSELGEVRVALSLNEDGTALTMETDASRGR